MGASSWIYYVPYQENIEQAFQELRQYIFETGDYNQFWRLYANSENAGLVDINGEEILLPLASPQTIEEAVKRSQPEGTHSILDISRLITDPRYYGDVPLEEEVIRGIFEDARPTKAMVEAIVFKEEVWSRLNDWFRAARMNKARGSRGIVTLPEEISQFFAIEHSKKEIVEVLLVREGFWAGIHSCLCFVIQQMGRLTRYGTAMPFSSEDLLRFFGSERPTKAAVEAACKQGEIWGHGRVGVGYYAIIYQDDAPHEIIFIGDSGD